MSTQIERTTLVAPDISCGHCEATVKQAVGQLDGVSQVEANASTKRVNVAYDPSRVSAAQIEAALAAAGYPVQA